MRWVKPPTFEAIEANETHCAECDYNKANHCGLFGVDLAHEQVYGPRRADECARADITEDINDRLRRGALLLRRPKH